jgi:hypothetical protein
LFHKSIYKKKRPDYQISSKFTEVIFNYLVVVAVTIATVVAAGLLTESTFLQVSVQATIESFLTITVASIVGLEQEVKIAVTPSAKNKFFIVFSFLVLVLLLRLYINFFNNV